MSDKSNAAFDALTATNAALLSAITEMHATEISAIREIALAAIAADPANGGAIVASFVEITRMRLDAQAASLGTIATFVDQIVDKVLPLAADRVAASKVLHAGASSYGKKN
jgi:hypothetical protein